MINLAEIRVELLASDQWNMRGVIRVTHLPTGAVVGVPYAPGYGQHRARTSALHMLDMILDEATPCPPPAKPQETP